MVGNSVEIIDVDRDELTKISSVLLIDHLSLLAPQAEQIVDQFEYAELSGKRTHGFVRVPWLLQQKLDRHVPLDFGEGSEHPVTHVDCGNAIGYLAANEIAGYMNNRSSQCSVRAVVAHNIFPTNTLGYYMRDLVQDSQRIGLIFGTTPKLVSQLGKTERTSGTNPLALGFCHEGMTMISDITTAQSSLGELLVAKYWGGFRSENFKTEAGDAPASIDELFSDKRFSGSIAQNLDQRCDQRLYSLSIVLQGLMSVITSSEDSRGDLVFVTLDKNLLVPAQQTETEFLSGIEPNTLPGIRSHARFLEGQKNKTLPLSLSLWEEITQLST